MERVLGCLADYRELADRHGAERSVAVATSAVRDAANGDEFRDAVRERRGLRRPDHLRRRGGAAHLPGRHGRRGLPARGRRW